MTLLPSLDAGDSPDDVYYEPDHPEGITLLRHQHGANLMLQIVPVSRVVPHERFHAPRVADLAARLEAEGRLINPPIAAAVNGKFVVLDGATRLTAFRYLGYPHIIVQVVDLPRQQVELHTWYHAVRGEGTAALLACVRAVPGVSLRLLPDAQLPLLAVGGRALGVLWTTDGQRWVVEVDTATDTDGWLAALNRVVEAYGAWGGVERTLSTDLALLAAQYPDLAGLMIFPSFGAAQILGWAARDLTVPAGITRFVIPGRILRLNAPLAPLVADRPLADKHRWLDELVRAKLVGRQVRYYEEPVVLLDE
jgi:hypothetical protein